MQHPEPLRWLIRLMARSCPAGLGRTSLLQCDRDYLTGHVHAGCAAPPPGRRAGPNRDLSFYGEKIPTWWQLPGTWFASRPGLAFRRVSLICRGRSSASSASSASSTAPRRVRACRGPGGSALNPSIVILEPVLLGAQAPCRAPELGMSPKWPEFSRVPLKRLDPRNFSTLGRHSSGVGVCWSHAGVVLEPS